MFIFQAGSKGIAVQQYSLYIPFKLSPGANISFILPRPSYISPEIWIEELPYGRLSLRAGYFCSKEAAVEYGHKLLRALYLAAINKNFGVDIINTFNDVSIFDERPIDESFREVARSVNWSSIEGWYDAHEAYVIPEHKRLIRWNLMPDNPPSSFLSLEDEFSTLLGNLMSDSIEKIPPKLKIAIELFSSSHFEINKEVILIRLISIIEILSPKIKPDPYQIRIFKQMQRRINKSHRSKNHERWKNAAKLVLEKIGRQKHEESISRCVRIFVGEMAEKYNLGKKRDSTNSIHKAYNIRSRILHEGTAKIKPNEIDESLDFLKNYVPSLLKALLTNE